MVFKYNRFKFFIGMLLCLSLAILVTSQEGTKKKCNKHEVEVNYTLIPSLCRPSCPRYFYGRIGIACIRRNGTECICEPGWVYDQNGTCIPEEYCPAIGDPHTQFSNCYAACQITCDCLKPQISQSVTCRCDRTCIPGYVCQSGYVRNATAGFCIRPSECQLL